MFEIDPIPLVAATCLSLALGTVWYSDSLFGKAWRHMTGQTDTEVSQGGYQLLQRMAVEFVARLTMLYVLTYFMMLEAKAGTHGGFFVAGLTALVVAAAYSSTVLWEKKSIMYLYITVGYNALVLFGGAGIIVHWPW